MAKLNETPGWVDVAQLETTDRVQGGAGGKSNLQAQELANRTAWLKAQIEDEFPSAAGASPGWIVTTAGLAGTTAVFKAMANLAA